MVGYSKLKSGVRRMFWSRRDFDEPLLVVSKGKFKDSSIRYTSMSEIQERDIKRWFKKSVDIQRDYKTSSSAKVS